MRYAAVLGGHAMKEAIMALDAAAPPARRRPRPPELYEAISRARDRGLTYKTIFAALPPGIFPTQAAMCSGHRDHCLKRLIREGKA